MKDSDFARMMPLVTAHLKESPPPANTYSASTDSPDAALACPPGDFLPTAMLQQHGLLPWLDALQIIHAKLGSDVDAAARTQARRRFVFNETLLLSLMMLHHRADLQNMDVESASTPVVCRDLVRFLAIALLPALRALCVSMY